MAAPKATLRAFQSHLAFLRRELAELMLAWSVAKRQDGEDGLQAISLHFSKFRDTYFAAIKLLNDELRKVIPKDAVESTPKAWCVNATKTLNRVGRWVCKIGDDGKLHIDVPANVTETTVALAEELVELYADVDRFLDWPVIASQDVRDDAPSTLDLENGSRVLNSMATKNPSRDAFKEALKDAGFKMSNAKAGNILRELKKPAK